MQRFARLTHKVHRERANTTHLEPGDRASASSNLLSSKKPDLFLHMQRTEKREAEAAAEILPHSQMDLFCSLLFRQRRKLLRWDEKKGKRTAARACDTTGLCYLAMICSRCLRVCVRVCVRKENLLASNIERYQDNKAISSSFHLASPSLCQLPSSQREFTILTASSLGIKLFF